MRTFAVPVFAIHRCLLGKMQCTFENENWRGWVSTFAVAVCATHRWMADSATLFFPPTADE